MDANTTTGSADDDGASQVPPPTAQARALLGLLPLYPGTEISAPGAGALAAITAGRARRHLGALADPGYLERAGADRFRLNPDAAAPGSRDTDPEERTAALQRVLDWLLHTAWAAVGPKASWLAVRLGDFTSLVGAASGAATHSQSAINRTSLESPRVTLARLDVSAPPATRAAIAPRRALVGLLLIYAVQFGPAWVAW